MQASLERYLKSHILRFSRKTKHQKDQKKGIDYFHFITTRSKAVQKFVRFDFVNTTTTTTAFEVVRDSTLGSKTPELFLHQNSDAFLFSTTNATGTFVPPLPPLKREAPKPQREISQARRREMKRRWR
jgi:hypothetical protein